MTDPQPFQDAQAMVLALPDADRFYLLGFMVTRHPETFIEAMTQLQLGELPVID